MRDETIYTLVLSENSGRYACELATGYDLTCGERIALCLGGHWIEGTVEHAPLSARERTALEILKKVPLQPIGGYSFQALDGNVCGLCREMKVKRLREW